jgi:hypothetical protein
MARRETPAAFFEGQPSSWGRGAASCSLGRSTQDHNDGYDAEEHVMWGFSARRGTLGLETAPDDISGEEARAAVLAVRASLTQMHRLDADSPISRLATKAFFRLADLAPTLQKRMQVLVQPSRAIVAVLCSPIDALGHVSCSTTLTADPQGTASAPVRARAPAARRPRLWIAISATRLSSAVKIR